MTLTDTSGTAHLGHWVSLELPYKLSPSYCEFEHYGNTSSYRLKDFVILGSNNDPRIIKTGFTLLFSGQAHVDNNWYKQNYSHLYRVWEIQVFDSFNQHFLEQSHNYLNSNTTATARMTWSAFPIPPTFSSIRTLR